MDLGCIDMGCIEKQSNEAFRDSETTTNESGSSNSKNRKMQTKGLKESGQSNMSATKTSQMKKNPLRKSSPLNWFPRKKVDSFLKRKIKQLQEVGGMNSTLDETLGDSNPHYSRVLREKIAVSEAAHKAMETRKAAMVEASWCRILRAASIQSKEAEALLLEAEKTAAEAFEAAAAIGVVLSDMPDCPRKEYEVDASSAKGTSHTVRASFESTFEVDKQVAAAVKSAFVKLASCPSINKEEFKELLQKISENPDTGEGNQDLLEISSECESDTGSEFDPGFQRDSFSSQDLKFECEKVVEAVRERKYKKKQPLQKFTTTQLVDMMLERLRCLQEDELASLATIVATCGLSAVLAEAENGKQPGLGSASDCTSAPVLRRISSYGVGTRKHFEAELPSLDKFLVKRLTKLEREVLEAKNARMNDKKIEEMERSVQNPYETKGMKLEKSRTHNGVMWHMKEDVTNLPSLDKFLVKHVSKLEREVQEAKDRRNFKPPTDGVGGKVSEMKKRSTSVTQAHKLEEGTTPVCCDSEQVGKENIDLNKTVDLKLETHLEGAETISLQDWKDEGKVRANSLDKENLHELSMVISEGIHPYQNKHGRTSDGDCESLDRVLVKHVSRLEKEKMTMGMKEEVVRVKRRDPNTLSESEGSLDQILVKHKSRLEKEKMAAAQQPDAQIKHFVSRREGTMGTKEEVLRVKRRDPNALFETSEGSLDQILVKHKSRLEKEKIAAAQQPDDQIKHFASRREARERELQEAWGGVGLGNSIRPHISRLERDKLKRRDPNTLSEDTEGSLDQILVKHKSRLEKEKIAAAQQPDEQIKNSVSRREARERELQEAWGGLSLGNSIHPHVSRLERDKAAWLKAEEEERRNAMEM